MPDFSHFLMVTDLDGTFLGHHSRLVPRNLEAIDYFKRHGGRFTTATGRIHTNVAAIIPDCSALFNAPAITSNGALVYDYTEECFVDESPMDPAATIALVRMAESLNPRVSARVSTENGFLVNSEHVNDMVAFDLNHYQGGAGYRLIPIDEWLSEKTKWFKMVIRGAYEDLCDIRPKIQAAFGHTFEYSASSPTFFEIQAGGCTKATAMLRLAERLSRREGHPIRTVALGDHENDLTMLSVADIAACPENALPEVKALSHHVLCPCDEGCIADMIERLGSFENM